jgi:hypothetical protein
VAPAPTSEGAVPVAPVAAPVAGNPTFTG